MRVTIAKVASQARCTVDDPKLILANVRRSSGIVWDRLGLQVYLLKNWSTIYFFFLFFFFWEISGVTYYVAP